MLKIILCSCSKILGSEWAWSKGARSVRSIVLNSKADWPLEQSRGYVAGEWDRRLRTALGKTAAVRDTRQHTVAVLPFSEEGEAIALVSLFGGDKVPEAVVHIGQIPRKIATALRGENRLEVILGYRVDPVTRLTSPITFGEIDRQLVRFAPTRFK